VGRWVKAKYCVRLKPRSTRCRVTPEFPSPDGGMVGGGAIVKTVGMVVEMPLIVMAISMVMTRFNTGATIMAV